MSVYSLCSNSNSCFDTKHELEFEQEVRNESPALIGAIDYYNAEKMKYTNLNVFQL